MINICFDKITSTLLSICQRFSQTERIDIIFSPEKKDIVGSIIFGEKQREKRKMGTG
jgi:hypothetical protein